MCVYVYVCVCVWFFAEIFEVFFSGGRVFLSNNGMAENENTEIRSFVSSEPATPSSSLLPSPSSIMFTVWLSFVFSFLLAQLSFPSLKRHYPVSLPKFPSEVMFWKGWLALIPYSSHRFSGGPWKRWIEAVKDCLNKKKSLDVWQAGRMVYWVGSWGGMHVA